MKKKGTEKKVRVITEIKKKHTISVDDSMLIVAIRSLGYEIPFGDPRVKVTFGVPGGGDWSNTSIDIDDENPVTISWEEHITEVKEEKG